MDKKSTTYDIVFIAVFAVLMAICSWISIPTAVPFTLQTFGVFLSCIVLGGKRGTLSVLVFILLGAIGIPVFSGFTGGIGVLFGSTGGYILGFILTGLIMWLFENLFGTGIVPTVISMVLGLILCYAFGTAWFIVIYTQSSGSIGIATALAWCVIPFIIPDIAKMALALVIGRRLSPILKNMR